ncbi:D-glycerate dehydrogenase [Desulfurispirillum indicum]|uniref:2-hydroxyacid dehydrogenase n=1 Tax=Desulfurispirillum indicum TaxID=936456 RepID=UPI001CFBF72C|nr:D-glycerate dehydrogenase [Desulfurispirillum indicum]UCZ56163.1 D-glycerate dehydrogenase [Desulfurispirillum indicum]
MIQSQLPFTLGITSPLLDEAMAVLQQKFNVRDLSGYRDADDLIEKARGCEAIISMLSDSFDEKVLSALGRHEQTPLKLLCNYAVGTNNIDIEAASRFGVMVTNTPGVLTEATADTAFALLMAAARRVREGEILVRSGGFTKTGWQPTMLLGQELCGSTIGIFGMGRIGSAVARRAAAFGMRVIYHNRNPRNDGPYTAVDFEHLLRESDIIVICAPATPQTRHRFTLNEFQAMKSSAILVNVGRGEIIREKDLALALQKGYIFAAGLDVYEHEPLIEPLLMDMDNVVLLPHLGSATRKTRMDMTMLCIDAIESVFSKGTIPTNCLNYRP